MQLNPIVKMPGFLSKKQGFFMQEIWVLVHKGRERGRQRQREPTNLALGVLARGLTKIRYYPTSKPVNAGV